MAKSIKPVYDNFVKKIVKYVGDNGRVPWKSPIAKNLSAFGVPKNKQRKAYSSTINQMILLGEQMCEPGYGNVWATFAQIKSSGGWVNKGAKATLLKQFYPVYLCEDTNKYKPFPKDPVQLQLLGLSEDDKRWFRSHSYVFNCAGQTTGMPDQYIYHPHTFNSSNPENIERLNAFLKEVVDDNKITIEHGYEGKNVFTPCYLPQEDKIYIPESKYFRDQTLNYVSTAVHEIYHRTGHPERLSFLSDKIPLSDLAYGIEEIRVEWSTALTMAEENFPSIETMENHINYTGGWFKKIEGDPELLEEISKDCDLTRCYLKNNNPKYQVLYDNCENAFEKHVVSMAIAKSSEPESFITTQAEEKRAKVFLSQTHLAAVAVNFPEVVGISTEPHRLDYDKDEKEKMMRHYQEKFSDVASKIAQTLKAQSKIETAPSMSV